MEDKAKRVNGNRVNRNGSADHTSFQIMDGFRKWAASIGMSTSICEGHILASKGRGLDHQRAYLAGIQRAYEKKDREYM